ncbi:hypothetical protein DPEC_G00078100 [Dallia pectoralis]|uniref:Uncharacterized protein n=1 Tax=Dallia pectoralis TaxID=75939 RepID=A0ACC2H4T5_DALPE|nr:hypothetical protein DPEC_G00078100 [Dallia pectoralis]
MNVDARTMSEYYIIGPPLRSVHGLQLLVTLCRQTGQQCSMDIALVNSLPYDDFVDVFGNVVERCPIIAAAVWSGRPFSSTADLEASIYEFIDALPESGKEGILRVHPDLAGRDLQGGTLTQESREEQGQAGLDTLTAAEVSRMARLNTEYKRHFGFPFVICARMNNKATILQQLEERLGNECTREKMHAIDEVKKICRLRLHALVVQERSNKL